MTETVLMRNTEISARRLRELEDLGVRIAIDDFGGGCSSLTHIQRFPVDILKIDRAFVEPIGGSSGSRALIGTLVQLGHDLGLRTIAEGVEEEAQLEYLRVNGIDQVQGFVFSRPLDPATFEASVLAPDTRAEAQPARSPSS